jgi:hypothetical protein
LIGEAGIDVIFVFLLPYEVRLRRKKQKQIFPSKVNRQLKIGRAVGKARGSDLLRSTFPLSGKVELTLAGVWRFPYVSFFSVFLKTERNPLGAVAPI